MSDTVIRARVDLALKDEANQLFQRLGLTDWNRFEALTIILDRIQGAPFTNQVDHARRAQYLETELNRYRTATKPAQVKRELQRLAQLVERNPDSPDLRFNYASLFEAAGELPAAESQWRALLRLHPQAAVPHFKLAKLLEELNHPDEAYSHYRQALAIRPEYFDARFAFGALCLRMDRLPQAVHYLNLVVQQRPRLIEARLALGQAMARARQLEAAQAQFQEILRQDPANAPAIAELNALR